MKIQLTASEHLCAVTDELAPITGISRSAGARSVHAQESEKKGLRMTKKAGDIFIEYHQTADFCRALGLLGAFAEADTETLEQTPSFETLGYMPDCSRNAVLSMNGAKDLMRHLAAMGYNAMMLYTEDTYEIPGHPYFGHMRGKYTMDELKELDRYALSLGIELIPCIQVLAHLNAIFHWNTYKNINDIDNILNIALPETYELIDAMLKVCAECFTSRRINLGMDEAHNLGRGRYYDTTGNHSKVTDLMHQHLDKILPMTRKYGFTPMMWSDMFFRPQYNGGYYTTEGTLSEESIKAKPDGVVPIYWDYYCGKETVDNMMRCHEQFGCEYAFAGGAWKWIGFAPNNAYSLSLSKAHLEMCKKHNVKTVFTTGWGDRGAEAAQLSVLPALLQYAEYCYNDQVSDELLAERFESLFGISLNAFLTLDLPNCASYNKPDEPTITTQCKYLLYNDPLGGLMDLHVSKDDPETYAQHAKKILAHSENDRYGYLFRTLGLLCELLEIKATLSLDIRTAYKSSDKDTLRTIANDRIPEILRRFESFENAFREQWYRENKTFGFDVQELYMGGAKERLRSAAMRLNAYLNGDVSRIEEVEQPMLDFYCSSEKRDYPHLDAFNWKDIVTCNII